MVSQYPLCDTVAYDTPSVKIYEDDATYALALSSLKGRGFVNCCFPFSASVLAASSKGRSQVGAPTA